MFSARKIVVVSIRRPSADAARRRGRPAPIRLIGLDARTGDILWRHSAPNLVPQTPAAAGGRVVYSNGRELVALELRTGRELWRTRHGMGRGGTPVLHGDIALLSGARKLGAFSADTGAMLWSKDVPPERGAPRMDLFVADGLLWRGIGGVGRDLRTGEVVKRVVARNLRSREHHHRCYRNKATDRYILSAKEGIELLDLDDAGHSRKNWVRGACKLGIMPCNGMIYVPPDQCFCEPGVKLRGFCALASREGPEPAPDPLDRRLERGPAFGRIETPAGDAADRDAWPTFRPDAARSGSTSTAVPDRLAPRWRVRLGGRITPPVVAGGKVFVAAVDADTLYALSEADGRRLWTYTAGGRIDSPPTVSRGRVLFGSADGWVTCLRAADGAPAWRFRAAPRERLIAAFGRIESAWPVHGSVLVHDGVVYAAAGRSSFLDGGIDLYGLDPATGQVRVHTRYAGPPEDLAKGPGHSFYLPGARNDVLSSQGGFIYMCQIKYDRRLRQQPTPFITDLGDMEVGLHLFSTGGFLDDSWYNRTYWMYAARWPGFYIANQAPKSGQLIVFDDRTTYAVKVFTRRNRHSPMFFPATDGYLLFADPNDNEPALLGAKDPRKPVRWLPQNEYDSSRGVTPLEARAVDRDKGVGFVRVRPPTWMTWVHVRIRAMVATREKLFFAGPPDVLDPADPLGALQGRKGGLLWAAAKADGRKLAAYKLDAPPVFDGLIAADGRLFLAARDGSLTCFAGP